MRKRLLAILCGLSIIMSTPTLASEIDAVHTNDFSASSGIVTNPVKSIEEQLGEFTEEQREFVLKKMQLVDSLEEQVIPYATGWTFLDGFDVCSQKNRTYCLAACCESAMRYLTGTSASQGSIAEKLEDITRDLYEIDEDTQFEGATLESAKIYLNDRQTKNVYVHNNYTSVIGTMQRCFYVDIVTYDAPTIVGILVNNDDGWEHSTNGARHAVCVTGTRNDQKYFELGDPWLGYQNSSAFPFYNQSATQIYNAMVEAEVGFLY